MFVKVRPGTGEVGAPQFGPLGGDEGVGLGKDGTPAWPGTERQARGDEIAEVHAAFHRNQGYPSAGVEHIADESARQRQRKISSAGRRHPLLQAKWEGPVWGRARGSIAMGS